ncbi:hypothetical protein BLNAU_4781 [Blattamonas nauphoetae]|uniref:Uncharacterized protein n=1 Tax=Blattamonas nauphoetae TaxID=2049346 RepID=A0ABQ9Y900_9EUKA|nr:hypothetical protein BLNAU_4781 [Blattamonas nauphoetae]
MCVPPITLALPDTPHTHGINLRKEPAPLFVNRRLLEAIFTLSVNHLLPLSRRIPSHIIVPHNNPRICHSTKNTPHLEPTSKQNEVFLVLSQRLPQTPTKNSQKPHINPNPSRNNDTHKKTSPTSPNPPSKNPYLPLPVFPPVHLDSPPLFAQHPRNRGTLTLKPHIVWFPHYETDPRILMEQTGSQDAIHNSRLYSSIPAYPMNVAPTQVQSESPTRGKKDQTARRLAMELRRTEKERKSESWRRTTREKNEDTAEDTREDESQLHTRRNKAMGETNNQRLLFRDWLVTTESQTSRVGVSESTAKLASIEKFH